MNDHNQESADENARDRAIEEAVSKIKADANNQMLADYEEWATDWPCQIRLDPSVVSYRNGGPTYGIAVFVFEDNTKSVITYSELREILSRRNRGYQWFKKEALSIGDAEAARRRANKERELSQQAHRQTMLDRLDNLMTKFPAGATIDASRGYYHNNEFASCRLQFQKHDISLNYSRMVRLLEAMPEGLNEDQFDAVLKTYDLGGRMVKEIERENLEAARNRDPYELNW